MQIDAPIIMAGLGVGFVVGLTGMGGGALMTPILVLLFGVDPSTAVGTDLLVSLVMKPVGGAVHVRKGTVNITLAGLLIAGSVPSAFVTVWIESKLLGPRVDEFVTPAIGVALLLASAGLIAKGSFSGRQIPDGAPTDLRPVLTVLVGVFGGVMVGLTSVGSGSLMMVLLLMLYPMLDAKRLVGTDLVQAVPLVAAATLGHALFGSVDLQIGGWLLVGALPGVWLGAHTSARSADPFIRPLLTVILVVSALGMLKAPNMIVGVVGLGGIAAACTVGWRSRGPAEADVDVPTERDDGESFYGTASPLDSSP